MSTRMPFAGPLSVVQAAQQRNSTEIDNITILPVAVRSDAKRSMLVIRDTAQGFEVPAQLRTHTQTVSKNSALFRCFTWGRRPQTPGIYRFHARMARFRGG